MLQGVIFDLDNTLIDSDLNFEEIRRDIGFVTGPVLEFRDGQATPEQKVHIDAVLEKHEGRAAENSVLKEGTREVLDLIEQLGLKSALLTRNSARSVATVLQKHSIAFDTIVSREDAAPKPSPEPVFLICDRLGLRPDRTLMVGDFKFDIECGANAGCMTVLLCTPIRSRFEASPDWEIDSLTELGPIVRSLMTKEEEVA